MKKLILIMCCLCSFVNADTVDDQIIKNIPIETREKIFKDAERKYPNNYVMMEYEAEKQFVAYIKYMKAKIVLLSDQPNPFNKIGEK